MIVEFEGNHILLLTTEAMHDQALGLDTRQPQEAAALLADGQIVAAEAVRSAVAELCEGANGMASTIRAGGVLHYIAAGSSGLMAAADALELGGTFSIPANQIRVHMAGGLPTGIEMPGNTEDDTAGLAMGLRGLSPADTVICVTASGSTPYTLEGAKLAKGFGSKVIGIANNANARLFEFCDYAVLLATPPELISGSTRMGAGTAQKIALNILSTMMAIELGQVHDGLMVNLRADNAKLHGRATAIVASIAEVSPDDAEAALMATNKDVKSAVLLAIGAASPEQARVLLNGTGGHLRPAMQRLKQS